MQVLPHYLNSQSPSVPDSYADFLVRPGQVVAVIWPEDPRSINKRLVEYDVLVQHRDHNTDTGAARTYRCTLLNDLCGLRDRSRLKLRAAAPDKKGQSKGSKVVVLCLNGEHPQAVIVGGMRDDRDTDEGWRDEDSMWEWEVNGVQASIDEAGEFAFRRGGPTDIDGKQTSGDTVEVKTEGGKLVVQPQVGVQIGDGSEKFPKFSTYRSAEASLHQNIQNTVLAMQTALDAIAVLHVIPIIGPILATPAFGQLAGAMATLAGFMATFEGQGDTFTSTRNTND